MTMSLAPKPKTLWLSKYFKRRVPIQMDVSNSHSASGTKNKIRGKVKWQLKIEKRNKMHCEESKENEAKAEGRENPAIILRFKRNSVSKTYDCAVCPCSYTQLANLKYHIRREHYNLSAKVTPRETRKINDVWFENVNNSKDVMEIKKTGHNKYLMKKAIGDCIEVVEPSDTVDLSSLYPDCARSRKMKVWCSSCETTILKDNYSRHLTEEHADVKL